MANHEGIFPDSKSFLFVFSGGNNMSSQSFGVNNEGRVTESKTYSSFSLMMNESGFDLI